MKNVNVQNAARASRWFANTLMFGALAVSAACGSSKSDALVADPNQVAGNSNLPAAGGNTVNPNTPASCVSTRSNTFVGSQSAVQFASAGGNGATLGTVLYITTVTNPNDTSATPTDPNQAYKLTAFDFDYCDFTYEFGYGNGPLSPFHAASFYLINGTPGAALTAGDYTIGATTGQYVTVASSTVASSTTSTAGSKCSETYFAPVSGKITLDNAPTPASGRRFTAGLNGSFNVTLANGASLAGTFTSGGCSANNPTTWDAARQNTCTCSL